MGSIYKRGRIYWIAYCQHGRQLRESSKSEKESDAKRLLKKREGEVVDGNIPGFYFDRVRYDDLAEDYRRDYRINGRKSIERVEASLKHLKATFEGYRITEITTPRIEKYIEKRMEEGAMNGTINRELAALKRMMNLGARQTPPKVNRVPFIPMLKEGAPRKGFFEHGDFLALRDALPDHMKGFVTFAYRTGWRKSEISRLTWAQVDLENGTARLEVGETKNNEGRTVYLDDELKGVLRAQKKAQKGKGKISPYVFPGTDGKDRISDFRDTWATACKKAGIGKRLFHDFRRTAVRNMVRAGVPERVVMMVSGHKTRTIFDRYNIVSEEDLKAAAKKQETYLKAQRCDKTVLAMP